MRSRKEMKKSARKVVRSHYWILLVACLIATFLGSEFTTSLNFVKQYRTDMLQNEDLNDETLVGDYRSKSTSYDAVMNALSGDLQSGKEISAELKSEAIADSAEGNRTLGRRKGVLADLVNQVSSGAFLITVIASMHSIGLSQNLVTVLFILLAALFIFGFWYFLENTYQAISRRIFLESRTYEKVPIQRFAMFFQIRRLPRAAKTLFFTSLFYWLWSLTIIGGIIKRYSYFMVPYIVAENPDVRWRDAVNLSRRMMDGHKWECFKLRLSFIPWDVLGYFTLGVTDLFFANSYRLASYSEYYADLRSLVKEQNLDGSELMNDTYLFRKAEPELLKQTYADICQLEADFREPFVLNGIRGWIADTFGVTLLNQADEQQYQAYEEQRTAIGHAKDIMNGASYPKRLFPIPERKVSNHVEPLHYMRHYSVSTLILMFFIFSFAGWLWEVSLHLVLDGVFVNRGVLHGPWLPIYGCGCVLILVILNKFRSKPVLEFFLILVLCGAVEYFSSYALEVLTGGTKWWDYSGYFLNLNGRICAEGLTIFGLGGIAVVYIIAPLLDNHLRRLKYKVVVPLCLILVLLYSGDQIYSVLHPNQGKGITDYESYHQELSWRDAV